MSERNGHGRVFVHQRTLPGWLGLLLLAPMLLLFLSLALALLAGGAAAAFLLPVFLRRRLRNARTRSDSRTIDLDPSQYSRVDSPSKRITGD